MNFKVTVADMFEEWDENLGNFSRWRKVTKLNQNFRTGGRTETVVSSTGDNRVEKLKGESKANYYIKWGLGTATAIYSYNPSIQEAEERALL